MKKYLFLLSLFSLFYNIARSKAIGGENFTRYKITEELAKGNVKLIPEVLIGNGNGNGNAMEGLLGLKLMEMMDPKKKDEPKK